MENKPQLLDTKNAARFLGLSYKTLESWRYADNVELPYVRLGGKIFYEVKDLLGFVEKHKVHSLVAQ